MKHANCDPNRWTELHDVAVEVVEAQLALYDSSPPSTSPGWPFVGPPGYEVGDAFVAKPAMGSAIGIEAGGTATPGGYVEFRGTDCSTGIEKVIVTTAMSCSHNSSSLSTPVDSLYVLLNSDRVKESESAVATSMSAEGATVHCQSPFNIEA